MDKITVLRELADALEREQQLIAALNSEPSIETRGNGFFWFLMIAGVGGLLFVGFLQGDLSI